MMRVPDQALAGQRKSAAPSKLARTLPYLLIAAFSVFLYHNADSFEFVRTYGQIGPDAWPKIVLVVMLVTACIGALKTLRAPSGAQPRGEDDEAALLNPPELYPGMVWAGVAATAFYAFALPILGFAIATVLYSIALMWVGHQRRLSILLGLGVGFSLFFMFLFMKVVYVSLPLGDEPFSKVSLLLMSLLGVH